MNTPAATVKRMSTVPTAARQASATTEVLSSSVEVEAMEDEEVEQDSLFDWPLNAWTERQAAQHRHARNWVVARAASAANSASGLQHAAAAATAALGGPPAQLRALARDLNA